MLVERAFIAHGLLTNVANMLETVVGSPFVYLFVTLEAVIGGKSGAARFTFKIFESAV